MEALHLLQAGLILIAQVSAGWFLLRAVASPSESWPQDAARAFLLGSAVLCLEMILLGAVLGSYSYNSIVLPWALLGLVALSLGLAKGRLRIRSKDLFLLCAALLFVLAATFFATPADSGDPGTNFAAFARLYGSLGRLDVNAAQSLSVIGHFEYPPLLALNESLFFQIDDPSGTSLLRILFPAYGLALITLGWGVLVNGLSRSAQWIGVLLLAILAVQPTTAYLMLNGYADLPLVCALLWMLLEVQRMLASDDGERSNGVCVILAGAVLALTKNEGIVLACGLALLVPLFRGWRSLWVPLSVAALASAWPLLLRIQGLESKWIHEASAGFRMEKISRLPRAAEVLLDRLLLYGEYPLWGLSTFTLGVLVLVPVYALRNRSLDGLKLPLTGLLLHFLLYSLVFSFTSSEFEWHLSTAAQRLVFHLVPYLLILAGTCLRLRPGEEL